MFSALQNLWAMLVKNISNSANQNQSEDEQTDDSYGKEQVVFSFFIGGCGRMEDAFNSY